MSLPAALPGLPASVPQTRGGLGRALGRLGQRLTRWQIAGSFPDLPKFEIVFAPHTSNWDFVHALHAKLALGMEARWVGKHTLFRWPAGPVLRRIGGIPVDRRAAQGMVATVVAEFRARPAMVFVIAPEGTRRRVEQWRSGYWQIASQAGVPVVPVGFDYGARRVVVGSPLATTDSREADERQLRAFFARMRPKWPANYVTGIDETPGNARN
jgi:1-acyl-sn-glycerol-3-phosphate acyltransferase